MTLYGKKPLSKHMFKLNWQSSFTFSNRYEVDGVIDRVFDYVRATGKKNLVIMDVGCSSAVALKYLKFILEGNGIAVTKTIGVDPSTKIREEAKKNLDEFISQDILQIKDEPDKTDVVICCKMILWVSPEHRVNIISKCSKFLVENGGLITDADKYEIPKDRDLFKIWCQDYTKTLPFLTKGVGFIRAIMETSRIRHKREMFLISGRENVSHYAQEVLDEWNKRGKYGKYMIHRRNFFKRIAGRFQNKPINKKIKRQRLL